MSEVQNLVDKERIRGSTALGRGLKELKVMPSESDAAGDAVLAEFLRSTLLRGNGPMLLANAARRARPAVTIAAFGVRNQLKPFSSLLMYTDQDEASAAPAARPRRHACRSRSVLSVHSESRS